MDTAIIDQTTAAAVLAKTSADLEVADNRYHEATEDLHTALLKWRPTGLVSVAEMAAAIGRARNYIDTLWSSATAEERAGHSRVLQTRVRMIVEDPDEKLRILRQLVDLADTQRKAHANAKVVRGRRDRAVVVTYQSKIMGPSDIAWRVGVDRNHVLRIVRNAGVAPVHRTNIKNQHTVPKQTAEGVDGQLELPVEPVTVPVSPSTNPFAV